MALFKIFKGNNTAKITNSSATGYITPTDGYAYYDTGSKLFYIDAAYSGTTISRQPINADNATNGIFYGTCTTAQATQAKVATLTNGTGFSLKAGTIVAIKFTYASAASTMTLNVNNTGAKNLYQYGTTLMSSGTTTTGWPAGAVVPFVYDGTYWFRLYWNNTVTTVTTTGTGNAITALTASNGVITATKGTTFLTSHQDISGKADKSATVSTLTWDSTNNKITKTINGSTSDVVQFATGGNIVLTGAAGKLIIEAIDTKVTQNNTIADNNYRVLLSASANDTIETSGVNKSINLQYNPSTNLLKTGNISGSGDLTITGNANLNGETYAESITANSLLVNGNANFVQIPTAPTPASDSNDTSIATTEFVKSAISSGSMSDVTYTATDGSIAKVANNTTTKIAADVPGYDPVTETITTIVNNVTVSGFYLDDDSDGNHNTQLYRSAANPLTGFTTIEDFPTNTRYSVIWDGIEYSCYSFTTANHPVHNEKLGDMTTATSAWSTTLLGNATLLKFASIEDNSSLPFVITYQYIKGENNIIIWTNSTETSHTITIKKISRNYKKLAIEEIPFLFNHPNEGLAVKKGSGYKGLALNNGIDAAGPYSIAGGAGTYASGNNSVALGFGTLASAKQSIALGLLTQATKNMAISTGQKTKSSGSFSLTLGSSTQASGDASIAAGYTTVASNYAATALGYRSIASGAYSLVIGTDNIEDTNIVEGQSKRKYIFIAGNGTKNNRSNAATIDWNGNVNAQTSLGVADAVQMVYNATTQALNFVFA